MRVPGTGLLRAATLLDTTVENGVTYAYRVTAADSSGNESAPSSEQPGRWLSPVVDTGGNTIGSVYPWCGIVTDSGRMQFLVPAAHIAREGTVTSLGLWIRSGAAVYHGVTVRLAHTAATQLESDLAANRTVASSQTTVYGPATVNSEAQREGSILPFALSAPFAYDGARNLLVEISWNGDDGRTVVFGFGPTPGAPRRLWQQPDGGGGPMGYEERQQFLRFTFSS